MISGRIVPEKERKEIRADLRQVLNRMSRETLLAQLYQFGWGSAIQEANAGKMVQAKLAGATFTDRQIINAILNRDVKQIVEGLEKGWS